MNESTYRCMIVPDAQVVFARMLAEAIGGLSGAGMWTAPLAPTADGPATHWISAGMISPQFARLLPLTVLDADGVPTTTPGNAALAARLALATGMDATTDQVQALFDSSDVTEQDPHDAVARLGLTLVAQTIEI